MRPLTLAGAALALAAAVGCGGHKARKSTATAAAPVSSGTAPIATNLLPNPVPSPSPSPSPSAVTLVLQPDGTDGKDTYVFSGGDAVNDNFGLATELLVGDDDGSQGDLRSLLEFSLASVPPGATVRSARLSLYVIGSRFRDLDLLLQAYAIQPTQVTVGGAPVWRTAWSEGASGSDAQLNGVCWDGDAPLGLYPSSTSRMPHYTQPDLDRSTDFGLGATGLAAQVVVARGAQGVRVELDLTALAARWHQGTLANHGLALVHGQEGSPWRDGAKVFASSDDPDPSHRPTLTISYDPVPGVSTLTLQPGPAAGKDTWVRNEGLYDNDNYGNGTYLAVGDRDTQQGDRRAYLQFDLGAVPANATITRATLELYHSGTSLHDEDVRIRVLKVVETRNKNGQNANQTPWVEGQGGYDATLDGMSWDGDLASGSYPVTRSMHPEFTQPDVDETSDYGHGPTGILAEEMLARGVVQRWVAFDVTGAVAEWVRGANPNHGLRVMHTPEGAPYLDGTKVFVSSDSLTLPAHRPVLRVEYRVP